MTTPPHTTTTAPADADVDLAAPLTGREMGRRLALGISSFSAARPLDLGNAVQPEDPAPLALGPDGALALGADVPPGHKVCTQCKQVKPLDAFSFQARAKDKRTKVCQACRDAAGLPPLAPFGKQARAHVPAPSPASEDVTPAPFPVPVELTMPPTPLAAARRATPSGGQRDDRYAPLRGLIDRLPPDGRWTRDERQRWGNAFTGLLDFLATVTNPI